MRVVLADDFLQQNVREKADRRKASPRLAMHIPGLDGPEHRVLIGAAEPHKAATEPVPALLVDTFQSETPRVAQRRHVGVPKSVAPVVVQLFVDERNDRYRLR